MDNSSVHLLDAGTSPQANRFKLDDWQAEGLPEYFRGEALIVVHQVSPGAKSGGNHGEGQKE